MEITDAVNVDLHGHLATSSDMKPGYIEKAVSVARERLGPGAILGIVNFSDDRYEMLIDSPQTRNGFERVIRERYVRFPEQDVTIVKGQEVPTQEGHLLVAGLPRDVHLKDHKPLTYTLREAEDNNGIVIGDHPFYLEGLGPFLRAHKDIVGRKLHALEIGNGEAEFSVFGLGPFPRKANKKAYEFWQELTREGIGIGAVSFSDGHSFYEIGNGFTTVQRPNYRSNDDFISSLGLSILTSTPENCSLPNRNIGRVGTVDHAVDLVGLTKVLPKVPKRLRNTLGLGNK